MKKVKSVLLDIARFFPIQLVMLQLKKSHFMVAIWLIFSAIITQNVGSKFGIPYLFLSPEYLGEVSWISFFILGFTIGGFYMAYHLYSYIIFGPSFPFLITFAKPFFKFSINNSFFPILFYFLLIANVWDVQVNEELASKSEVIVELLSLTLGIVFFILLSVLYFFQTNWDLPKLDRLKKKANRGRSLFSLAKTLFARENYWFQSGPTVTYQPSYYFASLTKVSRARPSRHYDREVIREIFRQNHLNASFFEIGLLLSFFALSLFQDYAIFVIPSGASFFLLSTLMLMVVTIFYSWFKGWAISIIVVGLFVLNLVSQGTGLLQSNSEAYGLSYETDVPYNLDYLENIQYNAEFNQNDLDLHISILEKWKRKAAAAQGTEKPKLFMVNCSGGGLRAAMWTEYVLQELDLQTNGAFSQSVHLMTGASGGMVGAAYFREIALNYPIEERKERKEEFSNNISKDLLNSVAFNLAVHDVFLRYRTFQIGDKEYLKDRGYSFEQQLNKNTNGMMDKPLGEYAKVERMSDAPLMIFSPTIINDGRRLIISSQPCGFLNGLNEENYGIGPENVEYIKLFEENDALQTRFTTVLRMNATFPYIMPMVAMPTTPEVHVMDAGIRDNYGTKTTMRYIVALQDWIAQNTSGVVIVQIRDINKDYDLVETDTYSLFDRVTKPASNFYGNFYQSQEFNAADLIENNQQGMDLDVVTFTLRKNPTEKVALSWHLTNREKNHIRQTFRNENNQRELEKMINLMY